MGQVESGHSRGVSAAARPGESTILKKGSGMSTVSAGIAGTDVTVALVEKIAPATRTERDY